jgi:hypothetical protein
LLTSLLDVFQSIGLLDHLSDSDRYLLRKRATAYQSQAVLDVLGMPGNVIIDVRDRNAEHPEDYVAFFDEMRTISRGKLDFSELVVEFVDADREALSITFRFAGRHYVTDVPIFSFRAFAIDSPIRTANRALAEAGIDDRFHNVSTLNERGGIEAGAVIFLSPDQRQILLEQDLIPMFWSRDEADIWTTGDVTAHRFHPE